MIYNRNSRDGHLLAEGARLCGLPHESSASPSVDMYFACDGFGRKLAEWLKVQRDSRRLIGIIDELERSLAFIIVEPNCVVYISAQAPLFAEAEKAYDNFGTAAGVYLEAVTTITDLKKKAAR